MPARCVAVTVSCTFADSWRHSTGPQTTSVIPGGCRRVHQYGRAARWCCTRQHVCCCRGHCATSTPLQFLSPHRDARCRRDNEDGWQDTARMPCERILGGPAGQAGGAGAAPPAYCRWFGVECCSPGGLAARNCSALHAVTGLRMPINNLNASVSNPDMLRPLVALHSCGLVSINLEASNLIGSLTDGWGALVNLEVLNLGMAPKPVPYTPLTLPTQINV